MQLGRWIDMQVCGDAVMRETSIGPVALWFPVVYDNT